MDFYLFLVLSGDFSYFLGFFRLTFEDGFLTFVGIFLTFEDAYAL